MPFLLAFLVAILGLFLSCDASKLLVAPTPRCHSHLMGQMKIAETFAARGHAVKLLVESSDVDRVHASLRPHILTYTMLGRKEGEPMPELRMPAGTSARFFFSLFVPLVDLSCRGLLEGQHALQAVRDWKPDLLLSEISYPCAPLIASRLNISWTGYWPIAPIDPYFTSLWSGSNRRLFVPNPLAYMPQYNMHTTTQLMSFWQRLQNMYAWADTHWVEFSSHHATFTKLFKDYSLDMDSPEERRRLVLTMAPVDMAAEWVRPLSPDFKYVGGILSGPGKPLPAELEAYMQSAGEHGVLLVSIGTIAELDLPARMSMAATFGRLPCKVLWRLTPKEVPDQAAIEQMQLGNNTKVVTWLPQNDVLAHPQMRAFLSHVGVNSQYEAMYHGKPVIAMPFFADQIDNAYKVVTKGYGVHVDPSKAATPAFQAALEEVLFNPKYAEAARRMSVKLRARKRTPAEEAADWLEHVIETGAEPYLHTPERYLPFHVRHNLDVHACILACAAAFVYVSWKLGSTVAGLLVERSLQRAKLKAS